MQHLAPGQVVVVDPDAVYVDGAVVGADGNTHRSRLREVITGRVLNGAGHDAVDVAVDQSVLGSLLYDKGHAHMLVFLKLHGDFRLLAHEFDHLRRKDNPTSSGQAGQDDRVIVHDRPG